MLNGPTSSQSNQNGQGARAEKKQGKEGNSKKWSDFLHNKATSAAYTATKQTLRYCTMESYCKLGTFLGWKWLWKWQIKCNCSCCMASDMLQFSDSVLFRIYIESATVEGIMNILCTIKRSCQASGFPNIRNVCCDPSKQAASNPYRLHSDKLPTPMMPWE